MTPPPPPVPQCPDKQDKDKDKDKDKGKDKDKDKDMDKDDVPPENNTGTHQTRTQKQTKKKAVPVWERLYSAETESTARLKEMAQSDEKKIKVFSMSGSGGMVNTDSPFKSPLSAKKKEKAETTKRTTTRTTPRKKAHAATTPPPGAGARSSRSSLRASRTPTTSGDKSAFDRLYNSETVASAKRKEKEKRAADPSRSVSLSTGPSFKESYKRDDTEPIHVRLSRLGTEASEKKKSSASVER